MRGFEPPTPSSRTKCATKLRYMPSTGREFTEMTLLLQALFKLKPYINQLLPSIPAPRPDS